MKWASKTRWWLAGLALWAGLFGSAAVAQAAVVNFKLMVGTTDPYYGYIRLPVGLVQVWRHGQVYRTVAIRQGFTTLTLDNTGTWLLDFVANEFDTRHFRLTFGTNGNFQATNVDERNQILGVGRNADGSYFFHYSGGGVFILDPSDAGGPILGPFMDRYHVEPAYPVTWGATESQNGLTYTREFTFADPLVAMPGMIVRWTYPNATTHTYFYVIPAERYVAGGLFWSSSYFRLDTANGLIWRLERYFPASFIRTLPAGVHVMSYQLQNHPSGTKSNIRRESITVTH